MLFFFVNKNIGLGVFMKEGACKRSLKLLLPTTQILARALAGTRSAEHALGARFTTKRTPDCVLLRNLRQSRIYF